MQTQEQVFLDRIKVSRGTAEPEQSAPTVSDEVVNVSEDAPIEDVVTEEAIANEEVTPEIEESATEEEAQSTETDLFYYDIDGEEVSSDQLKEWKTNGLMQADYTRKTQELADSRKDFESERDGFTGQQSKLTEQLATLEAMIAEDSVSDEDLKEMREYEPELYIKHLEKQDKRKGFLKEAKVNAKPVSTVNAQEEQAKLIKANPQWISNGKATEVYTRDMEAISNYYADNGFTQDQVESINGNANLAQAIIDAARFKSLSNKNAAIEKKVRKAPVSTRPKAQTNNRQTDEIKKLEAQLKKTGDAQLFVKIRKLKRQLNN